MDSAFDLTRYLATGAARVEQALRELFPLSPDTPPGLREAIEYSLYGGGKRLRPVVTLAACEALGGKSDQALAPACAIECIHTYSLIHDDLPCMDDDDERRGQPTSHIKFGEALATLAGDALLTAAFEILAAWVEQGGEQGVEQTGAGNYAWRVTVMQDIAHAAGQAGMVAGQALDLGLSKGGQVGAERGDVKALEYIHSLKTGALLTAAVMAGARTGLAIAGSRPIAESMPTSGPTAQADEAMLAHFSKYGYHLGLTFQIADDLLDAPTGIPEGVQGEGGGKPEVEASYVTLLGREEAMRLAHEHRDLAIAALTDCGVAAEPLRHLVRYAAERTR